MINIIKTYFNIYFTEIIIGILVFSILIVLCSIFHVLFNSTSNPVIKKTIKKNANKIKYTKEFLKGVDGIDLNLNAENKKKAS
jgi:hypothetical protein